MRLSYSALETYLTCPLKFKFREIDRIKTPQTKEAFFGSLIHNTLRMLHETSRLVPPTEEEVLQYFSQNWQPEMYENKDEETIAFSQGVRILKDYYSKNYPTQFNIVDLESRFEAPLIDGHEVCTVTGIIDRIDKIEDGLFEIIDYKTSRKMPAQKIVDQNLQLAVYHLGIAHRWPSILRDKKPVKLSLYFLQHGEKLSTVRAPDQLNQTKEKILGIFDSVKKSLAENRFDAQPGPLCHWCPYQPQCPLFKHKFKEELPDDKEIKILVDEFLELKAKTDKNSKRMSEIKRKISLYYDEQGVERVFSDSGYITRTGKKSFVYDGQALKEILEPLGKWKDVLKVDSAKLKEVVSSLPPDIQRKIEKIKKLDKETKSITITKIIDKKSPPSLRGAKSDLTMK